MNAYAILADHRLVNSPCGIFLSWHHKRGILLLWIKVFLSRSR
jgi:hypothetical protein